MDEAEATENTPVEAIEIECPNCGALCVYDGSYTAVEHDDSALRAENIRLSMIEKVQHEAISNWTARGLRLEMEIKRLKKELAKYQKEP